MPTAPDPRADDGAAADRLNRAWDAAVRGAVVHPGGRDGEDAGDLARAVARLHARDDAPPPDPVFAARLWAGLVAPPGGAASAQEPPPRSAAVSARTLRLLPAGGLRPWPRLVAAAILLALLGGGLGRGGLFPGFVAASPTVAAAATTTLLHASVAPACASPTPAPTGGPATDFPAAEVGTVTAVGEAACGRRGR